MGSKEFLEICKEHIIEYKDKADNTSLSVENMYVVWHCKTLQNYKTLLTTNIPDGMYYELTFNGNKNELYMDVYKKWQNMCFII